MSSFRDRRRQPFMSEAYARRQIERRTRLIGELHAELDAPDTDSEGRSLLLASASEAAYAWLSLRHTAGEAFESLRSELTGVVEAYERYQRALGAYEGEPDMPPLGLDYFVDYERALQIIGLCYLLHRRDLLPRFAALIDPGYKGEDAIYEDLLAYELEGRIDIDEWYFDEPYSALAKAIHADTDSKATKLLTEYVDTWYPCFKQAPWHDGHLRIKGTDGDYFGYWAFEAGAVALLCDIDDASITHMVYPKDMVAWAREHAYLSEPDAQGHVALRCPATHPCPRSGFWFTPAAAGKRQRFAQGDVMPDLGGAYGATLWQWEDTPGADARNQRGGL